MTPSAAVRPSRARFPLRVGPTGRYLVNAWGQPHFLLADTAWSLPCLTLANARTYLDDRFSKGFNAIVFSAMEANFWPTAPTNADGNAPWVGTAFQSAHNSAYWANVDAIIAHMNLRGMTAIMSATYSGFGEGAEGWAAAMNAATNADMEAHADFVGARYLSADNLIHTIGGDADPSTTHASRLTAYAARLRQADGGRHLFTAHWAPESQARDFPAIVNVDLDTIYTYSTTLYNESAAALGSAPTKPFILYESNYDNEHTSTPQSLRAQAYWALLSGACGTVFGNNPTWFFGTAGDGNPGHAFSDTTQSWASSLSTAAVQSIVRLKGLFTARPWHLLVPDTGNTAITAGKSTGTDYATAARASDGSCLLAYVPSQRAVTIALSQITASATARVTWHRCSTGEESTTFTGAASGTRNETPPWSGDSVLMVDAA